MKADEETWIPARDVLDIARRAANDQMIVRPVNVEQAAAQGIIPTRAGLVIEKWDTGSEERREQDDLSAAFWESVRSGGSWGGGSDAWQTGNFVAKVGDPLYRSSQTSVTAYQVQFAASGLRVIFGDLAIPTPEESLLIDASPAVEETPADGALAAKGGSEEPKRRKSKPGPSLDKMAAKLWPIFNKHHDKISDKDNDRERHEIVAAIWGASPNLGGKPPAKATVNKHWDRYLHATNGDRSEIQK